jgi:UDP-N-acetylglucosamine transferase subunit ALG13
MRVFVTVGTQLPFDRLVEAVDRISAGRGWQVLAQIGRASYRPPHMQWCDFIGSETAAEWIRESDLLITHAGMGTILGRLEAGGPMLVMPRRATLGEHRNEHQSATCRRLGHFAAIRVVNDEQDIREAIGSFDSGMRSSPIGKLAQPALVDAIRDFVWSDSSKQSRKAA